MAFVRDTVLVDGKRRAIAPCECGVTMVGGFDHVCDPADRPEVVLPTAADIEAAKTARGSWTPDTMVSWGVPWPPPKGWKADLLRRQD